MALIVLLTCILTADAPPGSDSYLARTVNALGAGRQDIPVLQDLADKAAAKLGAGGKLWVSGQPALVSEFSGRAGGFMMIRPLADKAAVDDVVLQFQEQHGNPAPSGDALTIVFADGVAAAPGLVCNHAAACGISSSLANAVSGWLFTGELFAALTRAGKTPVMFETIGAYSGLARIQQYKNGDVPWHDDLHTPPVAPGIIANRYVDIVTAMLQRVESAEAAKLQQAGAWARDARNAGKALYMYSMGHLFPDEIAKTEIGALFKSAQWNAGFRQSPPPNDTYAAGDFTSIIGYQHPATALLRRATAAGAKAIYVTVMQDRNYAAHADVVWLDPMWDWEDACVPVEGYDVPVLPASGVVNAAIAWEIYRLAK